MRTKFEQKRANQTSTAHLLHLSAFKREVQIVTNGAGLEVVGIHLQHVGDGHTLEVANLLVERGQLRCVVYFDLHCHTRARSGRHFVLGVEKVSRFSGPAKK